MNPSLCASCSHSGIQAIVRKIMYMDSFIDIENCLRGVLFLPRNSQRKTRICSSINQVKIYSIRIIQEYRNLKHNWRECSKIFGNFHNNLPCACLDVIDKTAWKFLETSVPLLKKPAEIQHLN